MPGLDLQRPHGQRRQRQGLFLVRAGIVDSVSCGKVRSLCPASPSLEVCRRKVRVPGERREERRDVAVDRQVRRHLHSSTADCKQDNYCRVRCHPMQTERSTVLYWGTLSRRTVGTEQRGSTHPSMSYQKLKL